MILDILCVDYFVEDVKFFFIGKYLFVVEENIDI